MVFYGLFQNIRKREEKKQGVRSLTPRFTTFHIYNIKEKHFSGHISLFQIRRLDWQLKGQRYSSAKLGYSRNSPLNGCIDYYSKKKKKREKEREKKEQSGKICMYIYGIKGYQQGINLLILTRR